MSSEIKVDTISENTSANGVAIDGVTLKDNGITASGDVSFDGGSFVFNESSADKDFRIEGNGDANLLFTDAGNDRVMIGTDSGGNGKLVINTDDENHIRFENGSELGLIYLGDDGDLNIWAHGTESIKFLNSTGSGTERARIDSSGAISTGGETAPDVDAGGLCLNQAANDTNILTFKSSDVAHGMTTLAETDTYATIEKTSGDEGGLFIESFSEGITNLMLFGSSASETTTKASNATGPVEIRGKSKSGTTAASVGANGNILCIRNHSLTRFIFDADGDFHAESGSTTFDAYEDAHLVRAYDLSHGKGVIDSKFDKFVSYNHEKLADLQLVGREEDGTPNHFINVTGMQRLHNGAIWQQYEKHQKLANAMYELAKAAVGEDKANEILEQNDIKLLN